MDCTTDWQKLYNERNQQLMFLNYRSGKGFARDLSLHSSNKEFYHKNADFKKAYFKDRIYYINENYYNHKSYLCVSDECGENVEILNEIGGDYDRVSYIHVNITGIYLYTTMDYDRVWVRHINFDGETVAECKEEYDGGYEEGHSVDCLYFYDNKLYYTYENEKRHIAPQLKCMNIDTNKIDVIYNRANEIGPVYANESQVIFHAKYVNEKYDISASGWMMLDLKSGRIECISNPDYNPEKVLSNPEIYDIDNVMYDERAEYYRDIRFFNLHAGIYWLEVFYGGGEYFKRKREWEKKNNSPAIYWVPIYLWGQNKGKIAENMPIWIKSKECDDYHSSYFDGFTLYSAHSYNRFEAWNWKGERVDWSCSGHGNCEEFSVLGGKYLFLDVDALGEKQYDLSVEKTIPLRDSWFGDSLSIEVISQYRNRKNNAMNSSVAVSAAVTEPEQDSFFDAEKKISPLYIGDSFEPTTKSDFYNFFEPTHKDYSDLKIGKLAQTVFRDLLEAGKATEEEVMLMQQADYSKKTFDLQFPVLVRADDFFDSKRYYSKPLTIRGVQYMMCSQWFETAANNDRPYLMAWINKHS